MTFINSTDTLLEDIQTILTLARQKAATAVNFAMVEAYLKNFRQFYLTFPENGKSYALRSELNDRVIFALNSECRG